MGIGRREVETACVAIPDDSTVCMQVRELDGQAHVDS